VGRGTDDRVELALLGAGDEVVAVLHEGLVGLLGVLAVDASAASHLANGHLELLLVQAALVEGAGNVRVRV
jgi:hypothetical protein